MTTILPSKMIPTCLPQHWKPLCAGLRIAAPESERDCLKKLSGFDRDPNLAKAWIPLSCSSLAYPSHFRIVLLPRLMIRFEHPSPLPACQWVSLWHSRSLSRCTCAPSSARPASSADPWSGSALSLAPEVWHAQYVMLIITILIIIVCILNDIIDTIWFFLFISTRSWFFSTISCSLLCTSWIRVGVEVNSKFKDEPKALGLTSKSYRSWWNP